MKLKMSVTLRYDSEQFEVNTLKRYLYRAMRDAADSGVLTRQLDAALVDYEMQIDEVEDFNPLEVGYA